MATGFLTSHLKLYTSAQRLLRMWASRPVEEACTQGTFGFVGSAHRSTDRPALSWLVDSLFVAIHGDFRTLHA
jgi:hypothetical protein